MSEWDGVYVLGKEERKWRNREQDELEIVWMSHESQQMAKHGVSV